MNYEALGIYAEAKDEYEASKKHRADKANELIKELRETTDSLADTPTWDPKEFVAPPINPKTNHEPKRLNTPKIQTLVKELIMAEEMMISWMNRANGVCHECDKMPLHFKMDYLPTL